MLASGGHRVHLSYATTILTASLPVSDFVFPGAVRMLARAVKDAKTFPLEKIVTSLEL